MQHKQHNIEYYLSKEYFEDEKKIIQVPLDDFKLFDKFEVRCPYLYRIRSEKGTIIPFIFNEAQAVLHDAIEEEFEKSMTKVGAYQAEIITCKPRQFGATTYAAARNMDMMLTIPNCYGGVLNHTDIDIPVVFNKYKIFYNELPDFIEIVDENKKVIGRESIKPKTDNSSTYELKFGDKTKSWVLVRTAGSGDNTGKGNSIMFVHFTESANYAHYNQVMDSVKQQMSNPEAHKFIINETTANGISGLGEGYYKAWTRSWNAWKKYENGESKEFVGERPVFIKWYLLKKYRRALIDGELTDVSDVDFGTKENEKQFYERERILLEEYNVPIEAINWYRYNIKTNCGYSYETACRYYPTFPEDAFLATSNTFFDSAKLFKIKAQYEEGKRVDEYETGTLDEELNFVPSTFGELRILHEPIAGFLNRYIVSIDQSEGNENGDFTSMKVFDRLTMTYVAHWYGKAAEDVLAVEVMKLGYFYNDAYIVPESNRATIINIIKPDGVLPYEGELFATSYGGNEPKWGWNTNVATRKILLDELYAFHRDSEYANIFDKDSLEEYIAFVRNKTQGGKVRYEAAEGAHDDIIFSDGLCIVANNRIDDEIIETDESGDDILELHAVRPKRNRIKSQSMLGRNKNTYVTSHTK